MKIEISNGELVDKVCILKIKLKNIKDPDKLINIQKEFDMLSSKMISFLPMNAFQKELIDLEKVNEDLWVIEDKLRVKEKEQEFDQEFTELARSVYFTNDRRSDVKKKINLITKSELVEEKSYQKYN